MKRVAVIGAGISGLAAASLLSRRHRVDLFEQQPRLGGHTNTVLIEGPTGSVPLDTGFLVHNDRTYPNLVRLFGELGVATRNSDMSFAVSCRRTGLEYSSRGANGFFAQRRNLVRPSHLSLLREIVRFNREAPALLEAPDAERQTLGDFLDSRGFGEGFTHRYLLPMASAIWSASLDAIRSFPALTLIRFFDNHGLLSLHAQPTWKVVAGGSHTYIPRLIAPLSGDIHQGAWIHVVRRSEDAVTLETELHNTFAGRKVNHANPRREFFFATPEEVRDVLAEKVGNLLEYAAKPEAEQYWQSRGSWPADLVGRPGH
jgi:predicted NAD/FAD-binding protein